jgi:hypothetical protein
MNVVVMHPVWYTTSERAPHYTLGKGRHPYQGAKRGSVTVPSSSRIGRLYW